MISRDEFIAAAADIYSTDRNGSPAIDCCKNKRIKARQIKLANRHITAAVKNADKPDVIQGFNTELSGE